MRELRSRGTLPIAVAPEDEYAERIRAEGIRFVAMAMDNQGTSPSRDLALVWRLYRLFQAERPSAVLTYTPKPNIYASLAAMPLRIPVTNNVAGLGSAFTRGGWVAGVADVLYRCALPASRRVFFQNDDDLALFRRRWLVRTSRSERLPGSGVDLQRFQPRTVTRNDGAFVVLFVGRILADKGVRELVDAVRRLQGHHPRIELRLLGPLNVENPTAIQAAEIEAWEKAGVVRHLGFTDDVASHIAEADCVVHPSYYREGVPRSLLEAAALGKPIITADTIGCRDAVDDGITGFLCRPRDAADLAEKMERMIALTPREREAMGRGGRTKMEREFDEQIVINRYLEVLESIGSPRRTT